MRAARPAARADRGHRRGAAHGDDGFLHRRHARRQHAGRRVARLLLLRLQARRQIAVLQGRGAEPGRARGILRRARRGAALAGGRSATSGLICLVGGWGVARLQRGRTIWIVAKTFVAAALIVLLVANLSLGDKRIEERVDGALYGRRSAVPAHHGCDARPGAPRRQSRYIYWSGEIGAQFTSALAERAKAGVKVHVLFDALGSGKIDDRAVEEMKAAGVEVEKYNPLRWNTLATINNRTHRKIMVVDGRIGYTGGVGIADEWRGNAQDP